MSKSYKYTILVSVLLVCVAIIANTNKTTAYSFATHTQPTVNEEAKSTTIAKPMITTTTSSSTPLSSATETPLITTPDNVIDEVMWVVGDEAILKSEVEYQRLSYEYRHTDIGGDPYVVIPEELAINKLFLHQAALDSIEVTENTVKNEVESYLESMIEEAGSEQSLELIRHQKIKDIRADITRMYIESYKINEVKKKIIGDSKISPAEVRRYFKNMPTDSLPVVPTQVEVQIITQEPQVSQEEIDYIKSRLVEYASRVNNGESFSALARMFSQDGSRSKGGELGFMSRGQLVKEFADVAFALTDPKTVSKIVKTEYGYHIIQLIERNGDKVNCRHILLKPQTTDAEIMTTLNRLDSVTALVKNKTIDFEKAVADFSDDRDSRNNHGLLPNILRGEYALTTRFRMDELHRIYQDIAKHVETMQVGDISEAFLTHNVKGIEICAVVKLKNRIPEHHADITADFQLLCDIMSERHNEELVNNWIKEKIKTTYIKIKDKWKRTGYKYDWLKQQK